MSKNYLLGFTILFLTACGGSSSGPSGSSSTGPSNAAPVISSGNTYSVAENTTAIGTVQASDADGDALAYFIQGDDSSLVTLTGNVLSFTTAPDFEAPADANSDNVYKVTVVVSDGSAKDAKDLEISVTNVNEGPQIIADASYSVAENSTAVGVITVSDAGNSTVTFSLSGADSALMTIGESSGVLAFVSAPDYENPADAGADNTYNVTVGASDGTVTNTVDVAVVVTDIASECPGACDLFFSEYAEGSSNNKYLEIANFTGAEVALSGYSLPSTSNAPTTPGEYEYWNGDVFGANDVVADGDVYVVCHGSADQSILDECDATTNFLSNGDDGRKLVKGTEDSFTVVDVLGDFQADPGSGWDVCGVSNGTKDHTLVKKEGKEGNADWTSSRGTNETDCDWIVADSDATVNGTWDGLGKHCYDSSAAAVTISSDSTFSVAENTTAVGTVVASAGGCASGTVSFTLSGADSALFTIDAAGALAFAAAPDFEVTGSASGTNDYTVVVTATVGSDSVDATLTVTVTDVAEADPTMADFSGTFDGTTKDGDTYTFPAGAQDWAGFSNDNAALYPFTFPNGGTVTFTAAAPSGDVNVNFKFEFNPYPDVNPNFATENVLISGTEEKTYTVDIPAQGDQTFSSLLMYIVERDIPVVVKDVSITQKAAEAPGADVLFKGTFDGTTYDEATNTFEWPSAAQDWAGFSNDTTTVYPLTFSEAGKVNFNASVPSGGDVVVRFRIEANPYPNVDPSYNTDTTVVSGSDVKSYSIDIPAQGDKTFNSFLMYLNTRDVPVVITDTKVEADTPDPEACGNRGQALGTANGGGLADICDAFDGTIYDDETKTYSYPTGGDVKDWAGFANKDTSIYPMKLGGGATITFDASVPSGGTVDVRFKFEKDPYPNNNPEFDTDVVTVSGATETQYTINVAAQDASVEWKSFLMYLNTRDTQVVIKNINVVPAS
ncbi:hypothetical protein N9M12_00745 [Gammaproteobacteria bacterium]|nr:hypothetical protein [Gammaproteobacteria bacterium]